MLARTLKIARGRNLALLITVAVIDLILALTPAGAYPSAARANAPSLTSAESTARAGHFHPAVLVLTQGLSPLDVDPGWFDQLTVPTNGAESTPINGTVALASYRPSSGLQPVSASKGLAKLLNCDDPGVCLGPTLTALTTPTNLATLDENGAVNEVTDPHSLPLTNTRAILIPAVIDTPSRQAALTDLAEIVKQARAQGQPILLVSYADTATIAQPQLVALIDASSNQPTAASGLIRSPRLRSTGLLGAEDVGDLILRHVIGANSPTALRAYLAGKVPPVTDPAEAVADLPIQRATPGDSVAKIRDLWTHARAGFLAMPVWFALVTGLFMLTVGVATLHFWHRPTAASPTFIWRNIAALATFTFATTPALLLANVFPWWRSGDWLHSDASSPATDDRLKGGHLLLSTSPATVFTIAVGVVLTLLIAATLTVLARKYTRHPVATLATLTLGLLAADLIGHLPLMRDSFTGYWTVQFARLYGATNRTFMTLIICGLLAVFPFLTRTKTDFTYFGAVGVCILAMDALPQWGADFGGPLGIIGAFAVAALATTRSRLRWWYPLAWIGLSAVVMVAMAVIDLARPYPSHIGAFWSSLLAGHAGPTLKRKALAALYTVAGTPLILAVVVGAALALVVFVLWLRKLVRRPGIYHDTLIEASAGQPVGAVALAVAFAALAGAVFNDSGMTIAADALLISLPAFIAILADNLVKVRRLPRE